MTTLAEVKLHAARLLARGEAAVALRLYDAAVSAAPLDLDARIKLSDALAALGQAALAIESYRAAGHYGIKSGHPLSAVVVARIIESMGGETEDLLASLVAHYGAES